MPTAQTAIIPDHCRAAIWIEADIQDYDKIADACKQSLDVLASWQQRFTDKALGLSIGFGKRAWEVLGTHEAAELKDFPGYGRGEIRAPATQHDLLIYIQSYEHDLNFSLALAVLQAFGESISVQQETHGFRRYEDRGLDDFVDGTENPQGDDISAVAIDEHGGSYVLLQRYRHDLNKWQACSLAEQEEAVARCKASNEEFAKADRHPCSHIARTNLREDGVKLEIVRRSLPYGAASGEHGLAFMAYCARLHNIEAQLQHMFGDTEDGLTDLLLTRLSKALSGGYYYAPSVEDLQSLAVK
ncbi:peroxidase [Moraxella caviae]|uniref:Peroxidase n=1 Tax=Moraxella caviae TaxID=34060 RepID=A0A1S9ZWE8_9GAMM|nr:Dyp-type peroxidase [Moraxella caviae]OOR87709.1 peroxidase [Moraxella caviae]STZ10118.1 Probable deferrochelatase/peroxidase YfeX [Moraxella caviae]VEW11113.1 Probable deferrochelatase/peroxidase YfeX [Moraxella caviae]